MKILLIAPRYLPIFNTEEKGAIEKLERIYLKYNETKDDSFIVYSPKTCRENFEQTKLNRTVFRIVDQTTIKYKIIKKVFAIKKRLMRSTNNENYIRCIAKDLLKRGEQNAYDLIIFENGERDIPVFKKITKTKTRIALHLHNDYINVDCDDSKKIINACDEIWVVSKFLAERTGDVEKQKTVVIGNTIESKKPVVNKKKVELLSKKYMTEKNVVFLYVGRIIKNKGINELLSAFDYYNKKINNNSKLILIGATEKSKEGKKISDSVKMAITKNKNIDYVGYLKPDDIINYQAISKCQIVPSICNESFGLVLLEAMRMHLAIIATRIGGIPEVGRNKIAYVEKDEIVKGLIERMSTIDLNKNREYECILEKYSEENFCKNVYRAIHDDESKEKVLLINQGHTNNIGDKAIYEVMRKKLEDIGYRVDFGEYCNEDETYGILWHNRIARRIILRPLFVKDILNRKRISHLIDTNTYSFAIIGGGELLSRHIEFNSSLYSWTKELKRRNIPIDLIGVSGDISMPRYRIKRYDYAIRQCRHVCVRDNYTKSIMWNKYKRRVQKSPDVAFMYRRLMDNNEMSHKTRATKTTLIVPITPTKRILKSLGINSMRGYYEEYLRRVPRDTKKIILTPTVKSDEQTCRDMMQYIVGKGDNRNVEYRNYGSVEEFIGAIKKVDCVVSARMHAMILALQYNKKISVICFKEKLTAFNNEYGKNNSIKKITNDSLDQFNYIKQIALLEKMARK